MSRFRTDSKLRQEWLDGDRQVGGPGESGTRTSEECGPGDTDVQGIRLDPWCRRQEGKGDGTTEGRVEEKGDTVGRCVGTETGSETGEIFTPIVCKRVQRSEVKEVSRDWVK